MANELSASRTISRERIRAALEVLGVDPRHTTWLRIDPDHVTWHHIGPGAPLDAMRLPSPDHPIDGVILMRDVDRHE